MIETTATPELVPIAPPVERPELTDSQRRSLLRAAANVVAASARGRQVTPAEAGLSEFDRQPVMGAFVTLKRQGRLRSCCGSMSQSMSLAQAVFHAACRSAADDHRFPPVSPGELPYLEIDVWMLFGERRCDARGEARRDAVVVGRHGLIISRGAQRGLLLPGVAVDHGLDADGFLQQVCMKAGLPPTAWKDHDTELSLFEGEMIEGLLPELTDADAAAFETPLLNADDLQSLAEFCRTNIFAALTGATPSFYAFGVSDANVNGVAVALEDATGNPWVQADQLSFRKPMPLQATLYALAEQLGRAIGHGEIDPRRLIDPHRLAQVPIHLSVLFDPAMHGTIDKPDLRGIDAARRAVVVVEGNRSAIVWNQQANAERLVAEAAQLAQVNTPEASSLFSFAALSNGPRMSVANVSRPQAGPSVRPAAVAGSFYPADAAELNRLVDGLLAGEAVRPEAVPAVMVPHAGLKYSGQIAADVLRRVAIPENVIVIGPKHTRLGVDWSVAPHETWSIPGANLAADPELARALVEAIPGLELDAAAHLQEHAIEVELPLIARLAPQARVTGIAIGSGNLARCRAFAQGLANCLRERQQPTLLVISSDMNHFASDAENRRLDELALAALETLDPAELYETVTRHHISMCGVLPAVIVMETLKQLDQLGGCRRVGYATSGDVTGDRSRVVGYAGLLLGGSEK